MQPPLNDWLMTGNEFWAWQMRLRITLIFCGLFKIDITVCVLLPTTSKPPFAQRWAGHSCFNLGSWYQLLSNYSFPTLSKPIRSWFWSHHFHPMRHSAPGFKVIAPFAWEPLLPSFLWTNPKRLVFNSKPPLAPHWALHFCFWVYCTSCTSNTLPMLSTPPLIYLIALFSPFGGIVLFGRVMCCFPATGHASPLRYGYEEDCSQTLPSSSLGRVFQVV